MKGLILLLASCSICACAQSGLDTNKWRVLDQTTIEYWKYINVLPNLNSCDVAANVSVTTELQLATTSGSNTCSGVDWGPVTYAWQTGSIENKTLSLTNFSATAVMQFPPHTHAYFWFMRSDQCQYPTDSYRYLNPCNMTMLPYPANPPLDNPNYYEIDAAEAMPGQATANQLGFSVHYANGLYTTHYLTLPSNMYTSYHSYTFSRNAGTMSMSIDGGTPNTITDPSPTIPVYPLFGSQVNDNGGTPSAGIFHVASFYICSDPTANPCTITSPSLIFNSGFNPGQAALFGKASLSGNAAIYAAPPPTPLVVSDNFTYCASTSGQLNANWTQFPGYPVAMTGTACAGAANGWTNPSTWGLAYWNANTFPANQYSQGTYGAVSTGTAIAVTARVTIFAGPNWSGYYCQQDLTGSNTLALARIDNGTPTNLNSTSNTAHVGDVLRIEAVGSSLVCKINGTAVTSASDSTYPTGQPGIIAQSTNTIMGPWVGGSL